MTVDPCYSGQDRRAPEGSWAKLKGQQDQKAGTSATTRARKGKRLMSAAAKAKIRLAKRVRWAKI